MAFIHRSDSKKGHEVDHNANESLCSGSFLADNATDVCLNQDAAIAGETYAFSEDRKLGITGAAFLIVNKMIGTGIFSTPSAVFAATGSVGISFMLWLADGIYALCGLSIYLEFGFTIPRSGGEKNYLERVYRKPRYMASCILAANLILLGFTSANALAFGRYVLFASGHEIANSWEATGISIACVSFAVTLHATLPKWGMRLSNVLGFFKIGVLVFIVLTGFVALAGHRPVPDPGNFENGFKVESIPAHGSGQPYAYANALLSVIFSFQGWENANYVVSKLRHPRKTLAVAAPLAVDSVITLYLLANVAYFTVIPKDELANSEVLVAGVFFRKMFGNGAGARSLPAMVALSNIGNVLGTSFGTSRFIQELGKEGILPFSRFWASNKPFNAPATSLFLHWIVTVLVLVLPKAGPAYTFIVNLSTYPSTWIQISLISGIIWLRNRKAESWSSPWHTYLPVSLLYLTFNVLLVLIPFVPPKDGLTSVGYPYYILPIVGIGVLLLGATYWIFWTKVFPYIGGYKVVSERIFEEDGTEVVCYLKVRNLHSDTF